MLAAPKECETIWVHVVMVDVGTVFMDDPSLDEIARFDLAPNGQAVLIRQVAKWHQHQQAEMEARRAESLERARAGGVRIGPTTRLCLLAVSDGTRIMVDVAGD